MNPIITEMQSNKGWKAYVQGNPSVFEYGNKEAIAISKLLLRLQGVRITALNGATILATVMWGCWLCLSWILILGVVQVTVFNGMMWGLFLLLAIFSSAYATRR